MNERPHIAVMITTRTQPGRRDELRALWEEHLKPRVEASDAQDVYFCLYDNDDPDVIHLFEVYNDPSALAAAGQSDWFREYMDAVGPLLDGPPEVATARPVWTKLPGD